MRAAQHQAAALLAGLMTIWLRAPIPATAEGEAADPTFGASAGLIEWCRSARDLLAALAAEHPESAALVAGGLDPEAPGTITRRQWQRVMELYLQVPAVDKMRPVAELCGRDVANIDQLSAAEAAHLIIALESRLGVPR